MGNEDRRKHKFQNMAWNWIWSLGLPFLAVGQGINCLVPPCLWRDLIQVERGPRVPCTKLILKRRPSLWRGIKSPVLVSSYIFIHSANTSFTSLWTRLYAKYHGQNSDGNQPQSSSHSPAVTMQRHTVPSNHLCLLNGPGLLNPVHPGVSWYSRLQ